MNTPPRVMGMLAGNISRQADMRTKYSYFFNALSKTVPLVDVLDVSLKGIDRWSIAAMTFNFNQRIWKERFFKNIPAFQLRSKNAARYLKRRLNEYDFVLQLGVLFNSNLRETPSRTLIYTDFTSKLSANNPAAGRSPFTPSQRARWFELEKQAYWQSSFIFSRSNFVKTSLVNDYGLPSGKIEVVGAGVNFEKLPEADIQRQFNEPTVLFIGSDFLRKGGDILLHAFASVKRLLPKARLIVMTNQPVSAKLPCDGVEIIRTQWSRPLIDSLYRRSNLLVLPSRLETWGDVLLEAMAYSLPCIGTWGQAMEEIIRHKHTGLLVEQEDIQGLSAAMVEILSQPERIERYGKEARRIVEKQYTWDIVAGQISSKILSLHHSRIN